MRDINRIDILLDLIREYWKQDNGNMDLRLGQLLSNIASKLNKDVFYIKDDIVIKWLEEKLNK